MADLLMRRSALGDVVLLGSVTAARRGVSVMTDARLVGLVSRLRGVDAVYPWPERDAPLPPGRRVDLQRSVQTLQWTCAARIRKHSLRRRVRMRTRLIGPRPSVPQVYGRACRVEPVGPPWFDLPSARRDTLALVPGAAHAPKRWSPGALASIGRRWDGPVAVLGGPGEEAMVAEVMARCPGARSVCESGFDETLEVLARTAVAVTPDSGLMHLAGAAGARVVGLFGPTHPDDGFFAYPGVALSLGRWCSPCTLHRRRACPLRHGACMQHDVEAVWHAVERCAG